MRVLLCGSAAQAAHMRERLKKDIVDCGNYDCSDNLNKLSTINEIDDLILVAADPALKENLLKHGIPEEAIIEYWRFEKTTFLNPIEGLISEKEVVDGLIFGMSHSQCAIDTQMLQGHFYKLAAPSLDLFFHLGFLNKILADNMIDVEQVHNIIIELPYYIFNYDLSRFGDFVLTKLKYFDVLGNYHHYKDMDTIIKWKIFMSIFDEGPTSAVGDNSSIGNIIKKMIKYPIRAYRIWTLHDKVWEHIYYETIRENTRYFNEFLSKLESTFLNAKIYILVMPFNPIFRISHRDSVRRMKNIFYDVANSKHLRVIDEFDSFSNSKYFDDHCHLNKMGGRLYTEHLVQLIKNN